METLFNPIKIWDHNSSDEEPMFEEEEVIINSSGSSSPISPSNSGPLQDMSSLFQQLPNLKRGLSKHYNGKSQSFTCLSKVRCKEDLAKPENPYQKKFKSCKSYAEFPRNNGNTFSSRSRRNSSFIVGNNRPPTTSIPPNHTHTSITTSNFTTQNPSVLFT